jgi:hypothetical protein
MPPPGKHVPQLPAPITEYFAVLTRSDSPRLRFIEKLMLLKVIADRCPECGAEVEAATARYDN